MDRAAYYDRLAVRLREARIAAGLTQAEIADAIGLSRASVANIERCHQAPGVFEVQLWARRCSVWMDDLLPA